jgi:predicted metallo-beta-lactamase superfamily hydrolase
VPSDIIGYISISQDIDTNQIGAGRKIGFKSYRSTTLAMNTLLDQYTNSGSGGGVVLQVLIPKGSSGLYADDFSANPGEREFILPRSSSIEILSGPNKLSGTYMSADNNLEVHFFNCKLV